MKIYITFPYDKKGIEEWECERVNGPVFPGSESFRSKDGTTHRWLTLGVSYHMTRKAAVKKAKIYRMAWIKSLNTQLNELLSNWPEELK